MLSLYLTVLLLFQLLRGEAVEPPNKRQMMSPYFLPELSHLIGYCEDKIPFVHLATCVSIQYVYMYLLFIIGIRYQQ